jgi:hypothetical protein
MGKTNGETAYEKQQTFPKHPSSQTGTGKSKNLALNRRRKAGNRLRRWTLHNRIAQLEEGINDTQMTAGSEAYQAALIFYNSAKVAATQGIAGAKAVYEQLKKRFPGTKRHVAES